MSDARILADQRRQYSRTSLMEEGVADEPIGQMTVWLAEARDAGEHEPTAMALATVSNDGLPSSRFVLLKALDARGFAFFTNLDSRKGEQLRANAAAALTFWWPITERQVRVEGLTQRVSDAEAAEYFRTRPLESKLGAWASPQSREISGRAELEDRMNHVMAEFDGVDVPLPPHWGGFRVIPNRVEFWQGRPNRLHDRIQYVAMGEREWCISRLAP